MSTNDQTKEKLVPAALGVSCAAIVIAFMYLGRCVIQENFQHEQMRKAAQHALDFDGLQPRTPVLDWWGTPLKTAYTASRETRTAVVVSAGKDLEFGTADDWDCHQVDVNKSFIIGEYAGRKSKELVKGLIEGVATPGEFKD